MLGTAAVSTKRGGMKGIGLADVPSGKSAGNARGYKRTAFIRVDSCSSVVDPSRSCSETRADPMPAILNDASVMAGYKKAAVRGPRLK